MLIYFLRHGDASSDFKYHENDRPLTELGSKQAATVGKFLQFTNTSINIILTSPLQRAFDTAKIVQSFIQAPRLQPTDFLVNGSNPKQLFDHMTNLDVESVLLVGHEPFLSDTISLLIIGNTAATIEIKKCSAALVEAQVPLQPGIGILKQLIHINTIAKFIALS